MAAAEQGNKTTPPQRRYQQNRPNYSNRGRGKPDAHVSKALYNFGVTDLREWLDQKHQQQGQPKGGAPPPDPSYNYLKDPSREYNDQDNQTRKYQKERPERAGDSWSRGHTSRSSRGRGSGVNRDTRRPEVEKTYIQNPVNIKIELKTATGERSCKLDEETKLANIKHVPDRQQQERRSFRGERGRIRSEGDKGRGRRWEAGRDKSESDRGRGERGRGGRGWGRESRGIGRGRGQGRYNPNANKNQQQINSNLPQSVATTEVPTEEDWDNECINPTVQQNDHENVHDKQEGNGESFEGTYVEGQEEYYEEDHEGVHEDFEEGDEEYLEASGEGYEEYSETPEESLALKESESDTEIKLDENLVITSSILPQPEENGKRTVRFKIDLENDTSKPAKNHGKQSRTEEKPMHKINSQDTVVKEATTKDILEDEETKPEDALKSKIVEGKVTSTTKDIVDNSGKADEIRDEDQRSVNSMESVDKKEKVENVDKENGK